MTPIKTLDLKHAITAMQHVQDNGLALADTDHRFRIISSQTYENIFALKLANAKTNKGTNNIDFSADGKHLAFSENEKPIIRVIDTQAKKVIHSFLKHEDDIESLHFSPDGNYLASGGVDGKVFLWSMKRGVFISRFASHPDYVAHLRFSPDGNYLISCGFEGSMMCTNIHTKARAKKYKQHKSRVTAISFASDHVVITGSKEGEVVVMNYLSGEILGRFMVPHGEVKGLACDGKVIYASGMQHAVAIYSLEDYSVISTHFISAPGVPSFLDFNDDKSQLITGCLNGKLAFYNLKNEDELKKAIKDKTYKIAYEIIQINPLLGFSASKIIFDETWEKTYKLALSLLIKNEGQKARGLLHTFQGVPKITNKIQTLLRDFDAYPRYAQLVSTKKLPAAYSLAEQFPTLQETPLALKIEKLWEITFEKAKIHMLAKNDGATTKLMLSDFSNIPSKTLLIQTLINDPDVFKNLIKALKEKDFKALLTLIAQHGALKETKEYQEAMILAEEVFEEAKKKLKEKDFDTVHAYAELILNVPHLHDQAEVLDHYALSAQKFMKAYTTEDYENSYALLDEHPFLIELSEAQELEDKWKALIDVSEEYAFKGNIKGIKETMGKFFTLPSRANRIGSLLKTTYLVQIKKYATSSKLTNVDIIKALNLYITLLSYDNEIEVIIKKLQKLRSLQLDLGDDQMEIKDDDVWLSRTNGNLPLLIFDSLST